MAPNAEARRLSLRVSLRVRLGPDRNGGSEGLREGRGKESVESDVYIYTHTHIYIYIYIYVLCTSSYSIYPLVGGSIEGLCIKRAKEARQACPFMARRAGGLQTQPDGFDDVREGARKIHLVLFFWGKRGSERQAGTHTYYFCYYHTTPANRLAKPYRPAIFCPPSPSPAGSSDIIFLIILVVVPLGEKTRDFCPQKT